MLNMAVKIMVCAALLGVIVIAAIVVFPLDALVCAILWICEPHLGDGYGNRG